MDKVIIYGAFEYIGFHFCNRLLEKGFQVKGIHFNMIANEYITEKRLEVGRNANFEELSVKQISERMEDDDASSTVIFSLYDLYMTSNESTLMNKTISEPIIQYLKNRKEVLENIVYLLPIQLLAGTPPLNGLEELENFLIQTKEITKKAQFFYLPTIFGPWQPNVFLFQRAISNLKEADKDCFTVREWVLDAIFIEDALEPIIEMMDLKKEGKFLLESGIPDSWNKCADILKLEKCYRNEVENLPITDDEQMTRITLKKVTPYHESLSIQKEHFLQILQLTDRL